MSDGIDIEHSNKECNLLGNEGIAFQTGLAFLSFFVLIIKRQMEKPKRSLKIWFLDVSKQGFSAATAHSLNLALAFWLEAKQTDGNIDSCIWYFVTIVFDTTIGVFISIFFLLTFEKLFTRCGCERLKSGNYFRIVRNDDPLTSLYQPQKFQIDCLAWTLQVFLWIVIVIISKVILGYLQQLFSKPLIAVASILFEIERIQKSESLELLIVLVITPTVGNAFQFWVSDNFLKKNDFSKEDPLVLRGTFFDSDLSNDTIETLDHSRSNINIEMGMTHHKAKAIEYEI